MAPKATKATKAGAARSQPRKKRTANPGDDRYRGLVEGFGDLFWEVDADLRYTFVSPSVVDQVGYTVDEVLGRRPFETTVPERAEQMMAMARELAGRPEGFRRIRWPSRRKDGREIVIEISGRPFHDADGKVAGYRGLSRDVTEQVRQEKLQAALYEISSASSTASDLADLFRRVHGILEGLMPARNLYVALVDRAGREISFPYFVDEVDSVDTVDISRRPLGRGLTEYVWRTGRTLLASPEEFAALRASGEVEAVGAGSVDWLGVPLKTRERTIGVLAVQSYEEGTRYTPDEARMLEFVSSQIALAIEHKEAEDSLRHSSERMVETIAVLEQRSTEMATLAEMGRHLQASRTAEEAGLVAGRFLGRLFPSTQGRFVRARGPGAGMEQLAAWGPRRPDVVPSAMECWALRLGRPHSWSAEGESMRCEHIENPAAAFSICVPFGVSEGAPGLITLEGSAQPGPPTEVEEARLSDLLALATAAAEQAALAVANLELREKLREQAIRDPLTGLYNRRFLEESLKNEIRRLGRKGDTLGLLMIDLDHFKSFNDTLGHEAGDAFLRALGRFIAAHVRAEDIACRYGGEEFTVLMPSAGEEQLVRRAEELRSLASGVGRHASGAPPQLVTLSIGAALFPHHGSTPAALLRAADEALYRAKAEGRNKVVLASASTAPPA